MNDPKDRLEKAKRIVDVNNELIEVESKLVTNLILSKKGQTERESEIKALEIKAEVVSSQLKGLKNGTQFTPKEDAWTILCLQILLDLNDKIGQIETNLSELSLIGV